MQTTKCIICSTGNVGADGDFNLTRYHCPRCGTFIIACEARDIISVSRDRYDKYMLSNLSGWVRENPKEKFDTNQLNRLLKLKPLTVIEKGHKLMRWLSDRTTYAGESILVNLQTSSELIAVCWAYNLAELFYLINNYLTKEGYVIQGIPSKGERPLTITPRGFSYLEKFNKSKDSNLGFCAMWFDEMLRPAWDNSIEPAIVQAGYDAKRIDKHPHNEGVVDEIIALIRRSKFVVADLTSHESVGERGGVYFEAGFAKGLGLDVIFTCKHDYFDKLHFDLKHYNFILWNDDGYEEFKNKLHWRIEQTLGRGNKL